MSDAEVDPGCETDEDEEYADDKAAEASDQARRAKLKLLRFLYLY